MSDAVKKPVQDYVQIAKDYLRPVKFIEKQIQSIEKEISQLHSNITSIRAIDYSKERVSGGGMHVGIENSVARFLDTAKEKDANIEQLTKQYCEASTMIDSLTENIGAAILRYEYLVGLTTEAAYDIVGFSESQSKRYRKKALEELGQMVANINKNEPK